MYRRRARHLRFHATQRAACLEELRSTPVRVLFLYTPAIAGRFVERMMEGPKSQEERDKQFKEYGWELLGPNPL